MPVPTPRTIQPLAETDIIEDEKYRDRNIHGASIEEDHIPEDWKDEGEVIIQRCKPITGSSMANCPLTNLEDSVIAQEQAWTPTIPEVPEEEDTIGTPITGSSMANCPLTNGGG